MSSAYENAMSDLEANNYTQPYPPKPSEEKIHACPCLTCSGYCGCDIAGHHSEPSEESEG